jgi:hypothetical protein
MLDMSILWFNKYALMQEGARNKRNYILVFTQMCFNSDCVSSLFFLLAHDKSEIDYVDDLSLSLAARRSEKS